MKKKKCYIYTRVSTSMQVDGYSLVAQKNAILKYVDYQDLKVVGEYSDEGKSGKNLEGRPDFVRMLSDIESKKDDIDFVLVYKLSRFGRNAADVLSSLQRMQDYNVNLVCTDENIDSSKDSGKLIISVLSAVSEIERENILVQTMAGRQQKAKEGKWNGGFAPYGYKLVEGKLEIVEDEAEIINIIYDKFVHTSMGMAAIAKYLNGQGYVKKVRQNGSLAAFSTSFVKGVLDNPVYCGKIAYGRRKTEKKEGKRNEYHIVKQKEYPIYDGIHKPIISVDEWYAAHERRLRTGVRNLKTHNIGHEYVLSSILKCPVCGASMYGNVSRKKKADGSSYRDYYFYVCKHRKLVDGHKCDFSKQWSQNKIDNAVAEVIKKLVKNPKFADAMKNKINSKIDVSELEKTLDNLKKELRKANAAKDKIADQLDNLDVDDAQYESKYDDLQNRLNKMYDKKGKIESEIEDVTIRIININQKKVSGDKVYQFLSFFDEAYDKFTDMEKKQFMQSFIDSIEIYPQEQPDGRILKGIKFAFPIYFDGKETREISWDKENHVETVALLVRTDSAI